VRLLSSTISFFINRYFAMAFYEPAELRPCAKVNQTTARPDYAYLEQYAVVQNVTEQEAMKCIQFRHPGYADNCNTLFELPAIDHPDGGIHYGLAKSACAIVANNRYDGFLSTSADVDAAPIEAELDDVLEWPADGAYYYHLEKTTVPNQ
jgi:hypothetical protein